MVVPGVLALPGEAGRSLHTHLTGVGLGPSPYLCRTSPFFLESTKHWPGPLNPAFSGT